MMRHSICTWIASHPHDCGKSFPRSWGTWKSDDITLTKGVLYARGEQGGKSAIGKGVSRCNCVLLLRQIVTTAPELRYRDFLACIMSMTDETRLAFQIEASYT